MISGGLPFSKVWCGPSVPPEDTIEARAFGVLPFFAGTVRIVLSLFIVMI